LNVTHSQPNVDGMIEQLERLFFGAEIEAPWPKNLPKGRMIEEGSRHLTLVFLGGMPIAPLQEALSSFPLPHFRVSPVGCCDRVLFLPENAPHVVASHIQWLYQGDLLLSFQKELSSWLQRLHYPSSTRPFLSHVTLGRSPFSMEEWREVQLNIPCFLKAIHLYKSRGHSLYESLWNYPLLPPFEEREHTADIAFLIRGESLQQLYINACTALAFKSPPLLSHMRTSSSPTSLDEIIIDLNAAIAQVDQEVGSPLKAVSFHGEITQESHEILNWEMIVDV
jgi:RNA 2',3'-cyclic 3'-phosphodiesterase